MKKTTIKQNVQNVDRKWFVLDAKDKTLGEIAVIAANKLRGKSKVTFTPHVDDGDYVVVLNAEKIRVTGNKEEDKKYYRHSGVLGNLKTESLKVVRSKDPRRILKNAVSGMLQKNRLRALQMKRLILVIGDQNPHEAQKAEILNI